MPAPAGLARAGLRLDLNQPAPGAATVTLTRPQRRNAMTPGMWRGLAAIGRSLPFDVRVVVVRGEGPTFSAGIDLRLLGGEEVEGEEPLPGPADPGFEDWIAECQEGFDWLRHPSIVSVAAVHGHAIGAGFQLALACDLRILADDARLSVREPTLGLVPDLLGTKPLVDMAGLPRWAAFITSETPGRPASSDQPPTCTSPSEAGLWTELMPVMVNPVVIVARFAYFLMKSLPTPCPSRILTKVQRECSVGFSVKIALGLFVVALSNQPSRGKQDRPATCSARSPKRAGSTS